MIFVRVLATEAARKTVKCTTDIKYCESDAALDIYYPPSSEGTYYNNSYSRAQNNGLSQVIFRPTLVYDRASPIW